MSSSDTTMNPLSVDSNNLDDTENLPDDTSTPKQPTEQPEQPKEQPEQPRNWMDILLKIGLGVCIFALLIMIYKLVFSDSDSLLGNSNRDMPSLKNDDFTLFPGLFDEPITLFERGDSSENDKNKEELKNINKSITEINDEITKMRLNLPCDEQNKKLYDLTQTYSEQYKTKEERDDLSLDDVMKIDKEIQDIWIYGSDSKCKIDVSKRFYIRNASFSEKCNVFEEGENDTVNLASKRVKYLLDNYQKPALEPGVQEALLDFIRKKKASQPDKAY